VDKLIPSDDPARRLPHGDGSAAWLVAHGRPELAPAVAGHPVTRLADPAWAGIWLATASPEARIVAYADKRAGQRLESMTARFASWDHRYPGGWPGEIPGLAWRHAVVLEEAVCAAAGIAPEAVRRLAWTGSALRAARGQAARGEAARSARRADGRGAAQGGRDASSRAATRAGTAA
jgi:hypothetical protein